MSSGTWVEKIREYCEKYNIPIEYLPDTINEPKVVPMIRGKAYEFSVAIFLEELLDVKIWEVSKPYMNAQTGLHDIDLQIKHIPTSKKISLECKLAAKGRFKKIADMQYRINIKCMRSRTLGESMVEEIAPKIGVSTKVLSVHNDQYGFKDFDFVVTSIGNAFYETNERTGSFEWQPTNEGNIFIKELSIGSIEKETEYKDFAFHSMYIVPSKSLAVIEENSITCTRRKCRNKKKCGFIPNYPEMNFSGNPLKVEKPWVELKKCEKEFLAFLGI